MIYILIGVRDKALGASMPIQCVNNISDEDIIESHRRAIIMKKLPQEAAVNYELMKYGTFEDKTGKITLLDEPVLLADLAKFCSIKQTIVHESEVFEDGSATSN